MSFEEKKFWIFVANEDCVICVPMAGIYESEPHPPHNNCTCDIVSDELKVELVATREEQVDTYEDLREVAYVPQGGETKNSQDWSTGTITTRGGEVSGEVGGPPGTAKGGGKVIATDTHVHNEGGSQAVTFKYNSELGGETQVVYAVYEVTVYQTINTYHAHFSEGLGTDFEFEAEGGTREVRTFIGYHTEGF
jgi:hypothetical protein